MPDGYSKGKYVGNNVPVGINMSYVLQNKFRIKITNTTQKTRAGKWIIDSNNLNSTVIIKGTYLQGIHQTREKINM